MPCAWTATVKTLQKPGMHDGTQTTLRPVKTTMRRPLIPLGLFDGRPIGLAANDGNTHVARPHPTSERSTAQTFAQEKNDLCTPVFKPKFVHKRIQNRKCPLWTGERGGSRKGSLKVRQVAKKGLISFSEKGGGQPAKKNEPY